MKSSKFFTKIFTVFAFVAAFAILGIIGLPGKAKAATLPVQLYYSQRPMDTYNSSHVEGYIAIQNLAFQKNVTVHYTFDGKTWADVPASYLKTDSSDDYEVWKFQTPTTSDENKIQFCIRYDVNGQTYWDNNNGTNYTDATFGKSSVYADRISSYVDGGEKYFGLFVATKNFTGININAQPVKIRYTEDNWNTFKDVPTDFASSASTDSILRWCTNINVSNSAKHVEFAILYEANGTQYWDNNFGSNYSINF